MVKMTGVASHARRLRRLGGGPELVEGITQALYVGADEIAVEAQISITTGAVSGKGHVASKPGEPPNADTHTLDRQIEAEIVGPLQARATSNAPYAFIEIGTSRMEARPYMRPAARRKRARVLELVTGVINALMKKE